MTTCTPRAAWITLLRRLHFYIGLFVGPFIFVAALTGTLYVATPQLEETIYAQALNGTMQGEPQSLAAQVAIAQQVTGGHLRLHAVRPGLEPGDTTRVMFVDPALVVSEHRAIFIDPVTLAVKGDMPVYGTSGILPLRQWIDYAHRSLLLGEVGRIYSELAASWMWVAALGGIALWWFTRPRRRLNNPLQNQRRLHVTLGWLLLVGMLLFSATGLTWSQWAGGNVDKMRAAFGWLTPQLNAQLHGPRQLQDEHADHHGGRVMSEARVDIRQFDAVLQTAQQTGLNALRLEIRPPKDAQHGWTVTEIDRRWPTQVDAIAVDPATRQVTDRTRFADFPLMAKLTRWGVDFHMGILLGWPNQLLLIGFGTGLCLMIVIGYRLWWIRRPARPSASPAQTLVHSWLLLSMRGRVSVVLLAIALGVAMPVLGGSLLLFMLIDWLRWVHASRTVFTQSVD
ncbi:PepSY-associated TM helix domain-containing protein [Citrobacter farmeri]|uniref:PepSY-associated TM helix domain-containing protein n=1 Tax=Citrobacter farmeri TaxID=67824 RepID=UPI000F68FAD5|nr:PepSY-associated TM helix domain-containing protein [Citrobacter farmeri]RSB14919.1 PepSY domain-containing protein [Citrobacter farmeri]